MAIGKPAAGRGFAATMGPVRHCHLRAAYEMLAGSGWRVPLPARLRAHSIHLPHPARSQGNRRIHRRRNGTILLRRLAEVMRRRLPTDWQQRAVLVVGRYPPVCHDTEHYLSPFYLLTAYTPTYGTTVLKLSPRDSFWVTLAVGITSFLVAADHGGGSPSHRTTSAADRRDDPRDSDGVSGSSHGSSRPLCSADARRRDLVGRRLTRHTTAR